MSTDPARGGTDDLARAMRAQSREAIDSDLVLDRVMAGVERRRRTRQLVGLGATSLAVTALVVGVQVGLPSGEPAPQEVPVAAVPAPKPSASCDPLGGPQYLDQLLMDYFAAGLDADDAAVLGDLWHTDLYESKAVAAQRLQDGVPLPLEPGAVPAERPLVEDARQALHDNGIGAEQVEELGRLWQTEESDLVVAVAGVRVLDGAAPPCL